ncbi:Hypothetical predicted protein [Octopus vulgaris]|uniref:rRNA adenine N(6)-methyltransferase n=2 Tax=Octopus TaxID=6643 RepID=A0AA36FAY1_OCTVU|nr:Hypothetical predicted protein [Octopus vulgaris]
MYRSQSWANCWSASGHSLKKLDFYYRVRNFLQCSYHLTNVKLVRSSSEKNIGRGETLYQKHAALKLKRTSPSYIFNEDVADKIASKIMETRKAKDTPIIEYNPGPCLLTKKLIKNGAKSVIGIEAKLDFQPYLQNTKRLFRSKFSFHLWDPYINVLFDSKRMSNLHTKEKESFKEIRQKSWCEEPYASIFGILTPSKARYFISLMINCLGTKESIYSLGRPELFLLVPARNYKTLNMKFPNTNYLFYRKTSSVLNLFFDIELLMELKVSDVFPHFAVPRKFQTPSNSPVTVNKDSIYFIKIVPKQIRDAISDSETYAKFLTFLNQVLQKRSSRLIPKMESWLPGSGVHLIRMGYTMMHLIGEVSPEQYLELYLELQKWPEFPESSLQAILIHATPEKDTASEESV